MKPLLTALFVFLIILTGCKKTEKPNIAEDKMVNILVDVHLAEAALLGFSEAQKDSLSLIYYNQIYEIHAISEESFKTEMDFLKQHPEYLEKTYKLVLEEIDKREAELNEKK